MKAIMIMYDSLNRHMLSPYGCDWTRTPNFRRLADRCTTFDKCYVGSLPCMPARREIHTGRYNFLHRSWGPMEPYDDSMPEILKKSGIHSHLISDHYHYWEASSWGRTAVALTPAATVPGKMCGGRKGILGRLLWEIRIFLPIWDSALSRIW